MTTLCGPELGDGDPECMWVCMHECVHEHGCACVHMLVCVCMGVCSQVCVHMLVHVCVHTGRSGSTGLLGTMEFATTSHNQQRQQLGSA